MVNFYSFVVNYIHDIIYIDRLAHMFSKQPQNRGAIGIQFQIIRTQKVAIKCEAIKLITIMFWFVWAIGWDMQVISLVLAQFR